MPQSLANVPVQIVFSTKNRARFLKAPELREELLGFMHVMRLNSTRLMFGTETGIPPRWGFAELFGICDPGLKRPGLSNLAPLGLFRESELRRVFVLGTIIASWFVLPCQQNMRRLSLPGRRDLLFLIAKALGEIAHPFAELLQSLRNLG